MKKQLQISKPVEIRNIENTLITLQVYKTEKDVTLNTAQDLIRKIEELLIDEIPILLMLSGGSSLKVVEALSDISKLNKTFNLDLLTISVVDERVVQGESNNFEALKKFFFRQKFYDQINWLETRVVDPKAVGEVEKHADKFEKKLRGWKKENYRGYIIALLGVGCDGHTSGILPFKGNPALDLESKRWIIGYNIEDYSDTPNKINDYHYRSTTTPYFIINLVDYAVVYMIGNRKKESLKRIVARKGDVTITPARILRQRKSKTTIFTDQEMN